MPRCTATLPAFCLAALVACLAIPASAEDFSLNLPPVKSTIQFGDQPVVITASGVITGRPNSLEDIFRLVLTADLAELQEHIGDVLKAQLNDEERCGDRLNVTGAMLTPANPASELTVELHYERWVCVKMLGKEVNRKLVGGDGAVPVTLSPSIEGNEVKLAAEVGTIEARGALGEILRSPPVRDRLKERIGTAIQSALQGGTNLKLAAPEGIERVATLANARFADGGAGRLTFQLTADIRMPAAEIRSLLQH